MPLFTKFPRTKLITIVATTLGIAGVWAALAWPDWTAPAKAAKPNPSVAALVALSKLPPQQLSALTAPTPVATTAPPAERQVVHRTVAVQRTVGQPAVIVLASDGTTSVQAPQQGVAPGQPQSAAAPASGSTPTSGNQAPPPPSQPGAPPPQPQPTVPVAAPPPSDPAPPPPPRPTSTSAPPPPAPTATPAPPPPAPTPTSGSAPP
jgi:hypothetical protein